VKRVTDIMAEISAASQEQSQGIEQVNQTITQMDEVTQQNAALVEEASAAARSLESQAEGLSASVAGFRVGGVSAGAVAGSAKRAASVTPLAVAARAPTRGKTAVRSSSSATSPSKVINDGGQVWAEF